jgi:hypothetical protein
MYGSRAKPCTMRMAPRLCSTSAVTVPCTCHCRALVRWMGRPKTASAAASSGTTAAATSVSRRSMRAITANIPPSVASDTRPGSAICDTAKWTTNASALTRCSRSPTACRPWNASERRWSRANRSRDRAKTMRCAAATTAARTRYDSAPAPTVTATAAATHQASVAPGRPPPGSAARAAVSHPGRG